MYCATGPGGPWLRTVRSDRITYLLFTVTHSATLAGGLPLP